MLADVDEADGLVELVACLSTFNPGLEIGQR